MAILPYSMYTDFSRFAFEWDSDKDVENQLKHRVAFDIAKEAFSDPKCVIIDDLEHSRNEERFYCIGRGGTGILTVRFTLRGESIRIIGAGYWRKWRSIYEKENRIH